MEIAPTEHLRKGKLECGLEFFVLGRGVARPKHSVELRLLVKVGSLMEEPAERGLAHFIEHLGFKGTKNFAKYELVRFLQSLGVTYGADLNASTHLLETTFQLSTELSSAEDLDKLKHAVAVLKEWAFYMAFDDHDVTEEKAVINAEYVSKQGLGERLLAKYWAAVFDDPAVADCKLAKRMPIGIPEVFMKTNATQLRQFYEKWYVPENMALVVVGDFSGIDDDVSRIVDILVNVFSSVEARPSYALSRSSATFLELPAHHRADTVVVLTDREVSVPQVSCEFFIPCPSEATHQYLRQDIIRRLVCSVYDRRLHCISSGDCVFYCNTETTDNQASSPFLSPGISVRQIVRGLLCFGLSATVHSNESESFEDEVVNIKRALKALLTEMKRFALHGVTEDEFSSAKSKWEMLFRDQRDHAQPDAKAITSDLLNHILSGEKTIFESPVVEAEMSIDCISSITLEEVNSAIISLDLHLTESKSANYYCVDTSVCSGTPFRVLSGQFPIRSAEAVSSITDATLKRLLEEIRCELEIGSDNIAPWMQMTRIDQSTVISAAQRVIEIKSKAEPRTFAGSSRCPSDARCLCCVDPISFLPVSMVCQPVVAPSIPCTSVSQFESIDVTEVQLRNGIKVALKWMQKSCPNRISMQAFALGGSTELSESEEIVMSRLDSIAEQSYFDINDTGIDDLSTTAQSAVLSKSDERILRGVDIVELQSRTKTYVSTQRHWNHRGIGGSCPSANFELLLAFVALKLTSQKILTSSVEKNISLVRSQLANMNNSPEAQFMERARLLTCGDIPISRPISATAIDAIEINMAADLYTRGFLRDPTEFTFAFVGDLPPLAEVKELLERYIAPLQCHSSTLLMPWVRAPAEPQLYPFTSFPAVFPSESVRSELNIRQADKSSVLVVYRKDIPVVEGALNNSTMSLDALCKVVEIKLLDYLRIQLGKVYNVVVDHSKNSLSTFALLTIGFHCEPTDYALIEDAIQAVIQFMQEVGPDSGSLDGVKEAMIKKHSRDLDSSSHWLFWILDSYKDKAYDDWFVKKGVKESSCTVPALINARSFQKLHDIRSNVNCEHIKDLIVQIFGGVHATVVLSPESQSRHDTAAVAGSDAERNMSEARAIGASGIAVYS